MLGKEIGGTELSIGQGQRPGIARGWLRQRELLASGGRYAAMHAAQAQWYRR